MALELEKNKRKAQVKKILSSILPSDEKQNAKAAAKAKGSEAYIVIDYPANGDKLNAHHYAVRIGAGNGWGVELSVDNGDWQSCREAGGYFWYDWWPAAGKHKLTARIQSADGKVKKSKVVSCEVS